MLRVRHLLYFESSRIKKSGHAFPAFFDGISWLASEGWACPTPFKETLFYVLMALRGSPLGWACPTPFEGILLCFGGVAWPALVVCAWPTPSKDILCAELMKIYAVSPYVSLDVPWKAHAAVDLFSCLEHLVHLTRQSDFVCLPTSTYSSNTRMLSTTRNIIIGSWVD